MFPNNQQQGFIAQVQNGQFLFRLGNGLVGHQQIRPALPPILENPAPQLQDNEDIQLRVQARQNLDIQNFAERQNRRLINRVRRNGQHADYMRNRRQQQRQNPDQLNIARGLGNVPLIHNIGAFDTFCEFCGAIKYPHESDFHCCHGGKITLDELSPYPNDLQDLIVGQNLENNIIANFQRHIRNYNSAMSFLSFSANIRPPPGRGPYCFRINGRIHHRSLPLYHDGENMPLYNQLYIFDNDEAIDFRLRRNNNCIQEVFQILQDVMDRYSPYAAAFRHMKEVEEAEAEIAGEEGRPTSTVRMYLLEGPDRRRYNAPRHDEVAVVFVGDNGGPPLPKDVVIYPRDEAARPYEISYLSPNVDPMAYPIFFPRGDHGWHVGLNHNVERATGRRNTVTLLQFYLYRLSIRNSFSPLFYGRKLFQQYIVDAYVKVEASRLAFIKQNQRNLRVDLYNGLADYVQNRAAQQNLRAGQITILPSSFAGSPRAMLQHYQDAMCIVSKFGKPDLFITFTCNPKWPEITDNLLPGQHACDRPDLVVRVFKMKLKELIADLTVRFVLGRVISFVYVIEFQKRGLPHAHILLNLDDNSKLRDSNDIDALISAEIPNEQENPVLFNVVKSSMVHGPCGVLNPQSPCMVDNSCSKNYPKQFSDETIMNDNGYPKYKRPNNGVTIDLNGTIIDNRWIVPYNPWLSTKFNAHINVEACTSLKSVKYLYKYIYKGHDCANIEINEQLDHNEIQTFLDCRYVSATESMWRLCEFELHKQSHTVHRLALHLPNEQRVYFQDGGEELALNRANEKDTMLTAWFKLNQESVEARQYLYKDIPYHYVFRNNKWVVRQRGAEKVISRLYNSRPSEGERFYLRMLLLHVPGATSFESLRTVNGVLQPSFRDACIQRQLLADDVEWNNTLQEATTVQMPHQLRQLFSVILTHGDPHNPLLLWENFQQSMIEDFLHRGMSQERAVNSALAHIDRVIRQSNKTLSDFNLPEVVNAALNEDIEDRQQHQQVRDNLRPLLTDEQRHFVDSVINAVTQEGNDNPKLFFLDGPAGSGKTFCYNYIVAEVKSRGLSLASAAWTGIAATLLKEGTTLHSLFKLPVPIAENSSCRINAASEYAAKLRSKSVFLFDEASMIPLHAFDAIDRCLKDICNSNTPFGGKVVILGGDFRQVLPVVKHGRPAEIIEVCLKSSTLWPSVERFSLTRNMRARDEEREYADWLLELGNNTLPEKQAQPFCGAIKLPDQSIFQGNLIEELFLDCHPDDIANRVILTPTNDDSLKINNEVLDHLPGELIHCYSADSIETDDLQEANNYPVEFLNSVTPSGMPPHDLRLKVGAIIMLLRNLDLNAGLCNGTRLRVVSVHHHLIEAETITGNHIGSRVLIPRVKLAPADSSLPFILCRRQFPIRLSYSMTINKSQGQTFDKVGLFLQRPCFCHGQLYVACSRCRRFCDLLIKVAPSLSQGFEGGSCYTPNIVYQQVL